MSFPATPPPDHLPKSSPGSPHSPPASPLPQDSETVNLVDSSDSDDEAQQKAKRLKRSQRAPNYLTFTFPVDISSILQQHQVDHEWPRHEPLYSEAHTDSSGVQWRVKMLTPGGQSNPVHLACFLEIAPESSLVPGPTRNVDFTFVASRMPTTGGTATAEDAKSVATEASNEVLSIHDSPESNLPPATNGAATPPLQPPASAALAAPATPAGGGGGSGASETVTMHDKHMFAPGERDWGFWKAFEAVKFLPSIGACDGPFQVQATLHDFVPLPPYDSKKSTGMVGLRNQGATCYMNSLLQSLFHLTSLRSAVYAMPTENLEVDSMALALQRVFVQLQTIETAVSTKELTKTFGWNSTDAFMQQDVQELNRILCDKLEEKMKGTSVEGTIARLFEGKVRSFIRCLHVPYESAREETFYDISLDVKGCRNVGESFRKYVETEKLEGENQYDAVEHGKQDAEKGVSFLEFPPVLNLQLKRFDFDMNTGDMVKINDRFEFPERLDLTPFLNKKQDEHAHSTAAAGGPSSAPAAPAAAACEADKEDEDEVDNRDNIYLLHSVLVHSGDVNGGHYYSYIKPQKGFTKAQAKAQAQAAAWQKQQAELAASNHGNSGDGSKMAPIVAVPKPSSGGKGQYFRFDDDEVRKATVTDAVEGSFGGPKLAKNNTFNSWTSAYMLVYVRESELSELMRPVPDEAIPAHLTRRFVREEDERAKQLAERKNAHKYMDVNVTCAEDAAQMDKFTSSANDFVSSAAHCGYTVRIKKEAQVWQMLATMETELGVPIDRMRLWKVDQRANGSRRPMDCLRAKHLGDVVAEDHMSGGCNSRCALYMEVLPEAGQVLDPDAPFTGLQPFPQNPPCNSVPQLMAAAAFLRDRGDGATIKEKGGDLGTAATAAAAPAGAAAPHAISKAQEKELYDPSKRDAEMAKVARRFTDYELDSSHGLIFAKFYNPDYARPLHGGDGHGEGGFLLPGSGTRSYHERELVFLGSALVRLDAVATQVLPRVCAALLNYGTRGEKASLGGGERMGDGMVMVERGLPGGGGGEVAPSSLRLMEAIKFEDVVPLGQGTLAICELDDGDIICCQKQSDVSTATTVVMDVEDDDDDEVEVTEGGGGGGAVAMALEETEQSDKKSRLHRHGFVTLPAPGSVMPLPRKVEDYFKYRMHRRIVRFYPTSHKEPRVLPFSSLLPSLPASASANGHEKATNEGKERDRDVKRGEGKGFEMGVTGGFELELSSLMTTGQVLHALANAIGFSDPLRVKLWSVTGESDSPQPFHTPNILNEFHLRNKAFDGHALKLEGAKKYGSNGVIFYEVVPFSIAELRDNVAMELEVVHHHWARVAGARANDKDLGTPPDVPTEVVAPLWPDAPPMALPAAAAATNLRGGGGGLSMEHCGISARSASNEPHSPPLLLPGVARSNSDDSQNDEDEYFSRTREVEGGGRVLTKFDPLGGTCSVTYLVPRGWVAADVVDSARRLLRVPPRYDLRLNEANKQLVVRPSIGNNKPAVDIARSPLNLPFYNPRMAPPATVKTVLEILDGEEMKDVPDKSNWIQVVVFSLTHEATRKRKQRMAANAANAATAPVAPAAPSKEDVDAESKDGNEAAATVMAQNNPPPQQRDDEDSVSWEVEIHGVGHLTYISPRDGVHSVRNRVLDRVPLHFRDLMTSPSSRPAMVHHDEKATFLKTSDLPPWQEGDETDTSQLYARVGRIINYQRNLTYAKHPTLGFEIPPPETERRVKKSRRLEEGIRINC